MGFQRIWGELQWVLSLSFADDTLVMVVKWWANIRAIKANLLWLELMFSLMDNFYKNMLVGGNVYSFLIQTMVEIPNCKMGVEPFKYFGMAIGDNPRRLVFWKPVNDRIRISCQGESRNLWLVALYVYFLSLCKTPSSIIFHLETIFKFFSLEREKGSV